MAVRNQAVELTRRLRQKDFRGEICALSNWVRDNIRYVKDIRSVETVHDPVTMLNVRCGDCDDKSLLLAALLESLGHPARFVAIAYKPGVFSHVWTQGRVGQAGPWIDLETTEALACGGRVPRGVAEIYQEI